jgi:cyclin A
MERIILKCLDFSVTLTTTKTFLTIYLSKIKADQLCSHLASFLSEVTLMRSVFLQFPPAVIAAAATVLAEFYLCREKPQIIPFLVDLDTPKLRQCIDILHADMMAYEPDQFQAIHEKYSEHKYAQVTSIVPRVDPLNVLFG